MKKILTFFMVLLIIFSFTTSSFAATIHGFVYKDSNHNGVKNSNEGFLNGVRMYLMDRYGRSITSELTHYALFMGNGFYDFKGLATGKYYIYTTRYTSKPLNPYPVWLDYPNSNRRVDFGVW